MNLMPLSLPSDATWRLLGSSESKPTKQPTVVLYGDGVEVMFSGTSVRIGWPLARKVVPCRVIESGELTLLSTRVDMSRALFLLRLGAMGEKLR